MQQSVRDYWITFNDPLEGRVNFMYLDVKGYVSTGIGNKIDETARDNFAPTAQEREKSLAAASSLRWLVNDVDTVATPEEIAEDWDRVKSHLELASQGHGAFRPHTRLHLEDNEIDRHVFAKLDEMECVLLEQRGEHFGGFVSWPANAQLATMSMCWAMGPKFRFPKFQEHVKARSWVGAADECHFTPDVGTIIIRNKLDRAHFLFARDVEDQGLPMDQIVLGVSDVFGVQGALLALGFKPLSQDGVDGPCTQGKVKEFQTANGLAENGAFDDPGTVYALTSQLTGRGFRVFGA
ncbi:peptidoglycan-binding protein (plasmid) [Streptomyces sp. NBC_01724]|uniref:peptidoglycan-binding domain-containing protein n=1 Tax=Streptomyces sp. NBC_01724 TaxID=2975922 RepID=UPI002E372039|nr:peptidoglycan-binding domain-containing protein [Streptomyces sp. NBC_01724]